MSGQEKKDDDQKKNLILALTIAATVTIVVVVIIAIVYNVYYGSHCQVVKAKLIKMADEICLVPKNALKKDIDALLAKYKSLFDDFKAKCEWDHEVTLPSSYKIGLLHRGKRCHVLPKNK